MDTNSGRLFLVSGPSGVGKDTLLTGAIANLPTPIPKVITATSRAPRGTEQNGVDYHFYSGEEFHRRIGAGEFLEYAVYGGHLYGTPISSVGPLLERGQNLTIIVEVIGAERIRGKLRGSVTSIFVKPPSLRELERRLRGRGTESEHEILVRVAGAIRDMRHIGEYDYVLTNDDLVVAQRALAGIIEAEMGR